LFLGVVAGVCIGRLLYLALGCQVHSYVGWCCAATCSRQLMARGIKSLLVEPLAACWAGWHVN
jgi:hypothetical protein